VPQYSFRATNVASTKTDPFFVEEEAPYRNTYMSRREHKSWSWVSRRLKAGITVLAKASNNLIDRPTEANSELEEADNLG
jgi:hypothetical protein